MRSYSQETGADAKAVTPQYPIGQKLNPLPGVSLVSSPELMRIQRVLSASLFLAALFSLSCSEAKRLWEEKTDTKPKTVNLKTSPSVTPNHSASPTASTQPSPKPTVNAAAFKGDIAGKAGKAKLYDFLEGNDQKIVKLDLLLSDEQLAELDDVDKGKRWYFDLAYPDKEGFNTGGELLIDISKGKGNLKLSGNHLTGNITVTNITGPHQGLMSILAKPAISSASSSTNNEAVSGKSEAPAPKPTASAVAKKKTATASNPPN